MKEYNNNGKATAILLFAQSEEVESTVKPIVSIKKQNVVLWKKMNTRVLRTIQKTQFPYFISNEKNQVGDSFGAKITYAIEQVFAQGFEKVIVVGNDCMNLQHRHLLDAANKLQSNKVVFGPDAAGGTYLMGFTKDSFEGDSFSAIPWQTKRVLESLCLLNQQHSIAFLPRLNDGTTRLDFKKALHSLDYSDPFRGIMQALLGHFIYPKKNETTVVYTTITDLYFNKGSPVL